MHNSSKSTGRSKKMPVIEVSSSHSLWRLYKVRLAAVPMFDGGTSLFALHLWSIGLGGRALFAMMLHRHLRGHGPAPASYLPFPLVLATTLHDLWPYQPVAFPLLSPSLSRFIPSHYELHQSSYSCCTRQPSQPSPHIVSSHTPPPPQQHQQSPAFCFFSRGQSCIYFCT
jgi:hypothetical protein